MKTVAYLRVSTRSQDLANQKLVPAEAVGCMLAATEKAKWKSWLSTHRSKGADPD